jgi:histidine ammonia-lyase
VPLTRVHDTIRARVAMLARDRPPSPDIAAIDYLIATGAIDHALDGVVN